MKNPTETIFVEPIQTPRLKLIPATLEHARAELHDRLVFQKKGLATEMVRPLIHWAQHHPDLKRIAAETEWKNPASVRVLEKLGFVQNGPGAEPGGMRFVLDVR